MSEIERRREEEAIGWLIRLRGDAAAGDWLAFTDWLEADPENNLAYQRITAADELGERIEAVPASPSVSTAANDVRPSADRRRFGWAAAASLAAAVIAGVVFWPPRPDRVTLSTRPGERRALVLEDGSRLALNGGTVLTVDRHRPRHILLARGEAMFSVRHDAAHPFEVAAGNVTVRDLGTVFDVAREAGETRIAVASGRVVAESEGGAVTLASGEQLRIRADLVERSVVTPSDVGGWRRGRLVFDGAPLAQVAAELSRTTGVPIRVDSALASRPFTGLVIVDHDHEALFRRLGPLLCVATTREAAGWRWTARGAC